MHHSSFSTSKSRAPLALAIVGLAAAAAALLLLPGHALPRLAWFLAAGACALAVVALVLRRTGRREDGARIEPTFETSILAFPPEPKLGPRPLRPH